MAKVTVTSDDGQVLQTYYVTASESAEGEMWNLRRSLARRTLAQSIFDVVSRSEREEQLARLHQRWDGEDDAPEARTH